ncbi:MAG: DUF4145 domain-containing protein [Verrucomicrobia bacterium]|nr:DUF4145 domain-containing protein [Verrucomicrobiota bacterium]
MSEFAFLRTDWPALHEAATQAESLVHADARAACFYTRRSLELAVHWLYRSEATLRLTYQELLQAFRSLSLSRRMGKGHHPTIGLWHREREPKLLKFRRCPVN